MKKYTLSLLALFIMASLALAACGGITPLQTPMQETTAPQQETPAPLSPAAEETPHKVYGSFTVSNDFVIAVYAVEHAVMLTDLHAFVVRDLEWELPVESQVLGFMQVELGEEPGGSYELSLPAQPLGTMNDVDNNGKENQGVQIFAVSYSPNIYGGPFSDGDDRSTGWPTYLASIKTDPENNDEVIGGKLILWSPDATQQFPHDFGEDGLLFTADDPVTVIPAGYSIVDLDTIPFTIAQTAEADLPLYEPPDSAIKDFSELSYTESFDAMFEFVSANYAFNNYKEKQPDWEAVYAELKPQVEKAEKEKDSLAFGRIIRDFTWKFKDGHVGAGGGATSEATNEDFGIATEGGYGFAIRELDDGRVLANYITEAGPAQLAGMALGAEITQFNGQPIREAIGKVIPWTLPHSMPSDLRYQQQRYLLRAPLGTPAEVTFANPGEEAQTVTLEAVDERASFNRASRYFNVNTDYLQPVDFSILQEGNAEIGYIRINANYDDLNLLLRLFERALQQFEAREVAGVIIDMRYNSGGAPLGLAGFLTDQTIPTGQDEYYSEASGKFEAEGLPGEIIANQNQYKFDKLALLVAPTCASACEYDSYGFSQVPGMTVVGFEPTGGIFAEVSRGQIMLPEDISLQIPTGRTIMPDGSLFLEGQGVVPTLRVPVDESTIYREDDVVLDFGIRAILQPLGAGITPAAPPQVGDASAVGKALNGGTKQLEEKAREEYSSEELAQTDTTFPYTIALSKSENLLWAWGWCAADEDTLKQNLEKTELVFTLAGETVPLEQFQRFDYENGGMACAAYITVLSDWQGGENHLSTAITFTESINDGTADYPPGTQIFDYTVFVKP